MKLKHLVKNMLFAKLIERSIEHIIEENERVVGRTSSRAMKYVSRPDISRMRVKFIHQRAVSIEW